MVCVVYVCVSVCDVWCMCGGGGLCVVCGVCVVVVCGGCVCDACGG